jgi:hypothetical protein
MRPRTRLAAPEPQQPSLVVPPLIPGPELEAMTNAAGQSLFQSPFARMQSCWPARLTAVTSPVQRYYPAGQAATAPTIPWWQWALAAGGGFGVGFVAVKAFSGGKKKKKSKK